MIWSNVYDWEWGTSALLRSNDIPDAGRLYENQK